MSRNFQIGYCGNVHPAVTVDQLIENLQQYTASVAEKLSSDATPTKMPITMPFGIWLSDTALKELRVPANLSRLQTTLAENNLVPFTINGFPFGDFHQAVVKKSVYLPDWTDSKRLEYTLELADLHHQLLPANEVSTISTLPLGWGGDGETSEEYFLQCAKNLIACVRELDQRFQDTNRHHIVCIEPEPGCVLDTCTDVVEFFQRYLFDNKFDCDPVLIRKHIGVCHDVCHSAVMFESQEEAISAYAAAGIEVGKVQVSSAIEVRFDDINDAEKETAREQLSTFCEPKYLHQTVIELSDGKREFYVDLPDALAANRGSGVWRIHFHVPIFVDMLNAIGTTQSCIAECLDALLRHDMSVHHFEVETYAWTVLPAGVFDGSLADGIAEEVRWFKNLVEKR